MLAQLMKKVRTWGFNYLNLTSLCGALPGKRRQEMPREAAYRNGLQVMRSNGGRCSSLPAAQPILPSWIMRCHAHQYDWPPTGRIATMWLLQNMQYRHEKRHTHIPTSRWLDPLVHLDPDVTTSLQRMRTARSKIVITKFSLDL